MGDYCLSFTVVFMCYSRTPEYQVRVWGLLALIQICEEKGWASRLSGSHATLCTHLSSEASSPEALWDSQSSFLCAALLHRLSPECSSVHHAAAFFPKVLPRVLEENKRGSGPSQGRGGGGGVDYSPPSPERRPHVTPQWRCLQSTRVASEGNGGGPSARGECLGWREEEQSIVWGQSTLQRETELCRTLGLHELVPAWVSITRSSGRNWGNKGKPVLSVRKVSKQEGDQCLQRLLACGRVSLSNVTKQSPSLELNSLCQSCSFLLSTGWTAFFFFLI